MIWETPFTCFTTGSFADIQCILGQGFSGILGGPIVATIIVLILALILSFKLRLAPELIVVFMFSIIFVSAMAFAPDWIKWAFLIILAIIVGFGVNKFLKRGG